ncbi:hypothetical protein ADK76_16360 [Streptomyces griseoflavus]|uniref:hypothetical protein n=1 Tax=Streptomyces TaxID=1883 RepID=UPI0004CC3B6E|nr:MULTISPECIES: hypothetical protein [Streptomyces]KOG59217.1 hypothetical protein ADK76_16360 [Streptomyces griseoflavus]KOT88844.1 hypothetical protein ADK86_31170 [Streptomyces sp. NRRL F-5755]KWT63586.1 hypothetical protein ADL21_02070 [Streptomyces albus subsp. albus]
MTDRDREGARRFSGRTALATFVAVTALAAAGVWFSQAADRASAVDAAPKTSAVRDVKGAAKATGGLPGVRDCGFGEPEIKPKVITLTCADAAMVATGIVWERYGAAEAEGKGVVQVEKAAAGAGTDAGFPATFRLYGAKTVDGARAFTGLEVTYEGSTPLGDSTEMYNLA